MSVGNSHPLTSSHRNSGPTGSSSSSDSGPRVLYPDLMKSHDGFVEKHVGAERERLMDNAVQRDAQANPSRNDPSEYEKRMAPHKAAFKALLEKKGALEYRFTGEQTKSPRREVKTVRWSEDTNKTYDMQGGDKAPPSTSAFEKSEAGPRRASLRRDRTKEEARKTKIEAGIQASLKILEADARPASVPANQVLAPKKRTFPEDRKAKAEHLANLEKDVLSELDKVETSKKRTSVAHELDKIVGDLENSTPAVAPVKKGRADRSGDKATASTAESKLEKTRRRDQMEKDVLAEVDKLARSHTDQVMDKLDELERELEGELDPHGLDKALREMEALAAGEIKESRENAGSGQATSKSTSSLPQTRPHGPATGKPPSSSNSWIEDDAPPPAVLKARSELAGIIARHSAQLSGATIKTRQAIALAQELSSALGEGHVLGARMATDKLVAYLTGPKAPSTVSGEWLRSELQKITARLQ